MHIKNKKHFTKLVTYDKIDKVLDFGGENMAKLILRESCFKGIDNVVVKEIKKTSAHKTFVKQANEQIERNRLRYATAYNRAESYLSN